MRSKGWGWRDALGEFIKVGMGGWAQGRRPETQQH